MIELPNTQVWRGGISSNYVNKESSSVRCQGRTHNSRQGEPCITLVHNLASKGGGTTQVIIDIGPQGFEGLIREMMIADREATRRAFAAVSS